MASNSAGNSSQLELDESTSPQQVFKELRVSLVDFGWLADLGEETGTDYESVSESESGSDADQSDKSSDKMDYQNEEEDEVTGFERGLEPRQIIGTFIDHDGDMVFVVRWEGLPDNVFDPVLAEEVKVRCPQLVAEFYEARAMFPEHDAANFTNPGDDDDDDSLMDSESNADSDFDADSDKENRVPSDYEEMEVEDFNFYQLN